jgi:hypothetical protein
MNRVIAILVTVSITSGCATTGRTRIMVGAGMGASVGAVGGNFLSPNDESRGINSLVFGLAGAIIGGLTALLTDAQPPISESKPSLKDRDLGATPDARDFIVPADRTLPEFVRRRLQPTVIEESTQQDEVTEEGTLHEPHKVYRIKRMPELFSNPVSPKSQGGAK